MSGINIVVDTNVLIYLSEGKGNANFYLEGNLVYVSVISEMELLGHHRISQKEISFYEKLLGECSIVELLRPIKEEAIRLRQSTQIKLPDAIIAATSLYLNAPLVTFDKGFSRIKNLDVIIPEL
ncbi:MAG: type II toxin-antitoxin system VapC family toxin [Bacteroidia bacterium]|nr:type II toxin-antitoxin system VapC family toxin [Bacteroidia bacterium]